MKSARQISSIPATIPAVVGTVHSPASLRAALRLSAGAVDYLELRVDNFAGDLKPLLRAVPKLKIPCIVTVRHPREGGANKVGMALRRELYLEFLPHAAAIDLELRSAEALSEVIVAARADGVCVILSTHNFRRTPPIADLVESVRRAYRAGANVCKLAAFTAKPADTAVLLTLLAKKLPLPLSVMGMGPLGKASRLLLAKAGSVLNYGYLDAPNAPGQWEARELKLILSKI